MKTEWARISSEVKEAKAIRSNFYSRLGAAIRRERSVLRISQDELARRSSLHRTYISELERGARNPSVGSIQKIAHALQVPVAKRFEQDGDRDS
jgi:transcriptional regulator with XRE-family HTH domain